MGSGSDPTATLTVTDSTPSSDTSLSGITATLNGVMRSGRVVGPIDLSVVPSTSAGSDYTATGVWAEIADCVTKYVIVTPVLNDSHAALNMYEGNRIDNITDAGGSRNFKVTAEDGTEKNYCITVTFS